MCGRYAASKDTAGLVEAFEIDEVIDEAPPASYNVAPTDRVPIVVQRPATAEHALSRQLRAAKWGLVPSWAQEATGGARLINARWESLAKQPAFRKAFTKRRAVLPADGYFEWQRPPGGGPKKPYFIHRRDGQPLALAGLFEFWRPNRDTPWLVTATVITGPASPGLAAIHDRMPVLLPPELLTPWLDPEHLFSGELPGLPEELLVADAVSTAVNSVRNNGPELLERIAG